MLRGDTATATKTKGRMHHVMPRYSYSDKNQREHASCDAVIQLQRQKPEDQTQKPEDQNQRILLSC